MSGPEPTDTATRRPIQPPRRALSSSTSLRPVLHTAQTSGRHELENPTLSHPLSPSSLSQSTTIGRGSAVNESRQYTQPLQPSFTGVPAAAEAQNLELAGHLATYGFPPGGPSVWDWSESSGAGEYGTIYEPQGELQLQLQAQQVPQADFSNPFPVLQENSHEKLNVEQAPSRAQGKGMISPAQAVTYDMSKPMASSTITTRAGQKRKAESKEAASRSELHSATTQTTQEPLAKRPSLSKPLPSSTQQNSPLVTRSQQTSEAGRGDDEESEPPEPRQFVSEQTEPEASVERRIAEVSARLSTVLPAGKAFPIQIGSELFRLSGASISSDAPSYFSHYFGEQLIQTGGRASQVRTLYIDRDPNTFKDIALHLQGYFVKPHDEEHFVRLFADAQFYSLPRLTQQLFKSEIFIQVGHRHFQIPRDIFNSPGDSPNFFSLGFAHFFSTPSEIFPGLDKQTLLRPPSILPPAIPNRSGDVFADLLRILQGYEVPIRDASHRAELLRDARYFHLKGVEQKLIPCKITHNTLRDRSEILVRLEDIRQSGVNFLSEVSLQSLPGSKPGTPLSTAEKSLLPSGWITYQRPYVDGAARDLVLEISSTEATILDLTTMRATFTGQTKARIASLFSVIANKLNLPTTMPLGLMMIQSGGGIAAQSASPANSGLSGDRVRIRITSDACVILDGEAIDWDDKESWNEEDGGVTHPNVGAPPHVKRWKAGRNLHEEMQWIISKGQWRLRVEKQDAGNGLSDGPMEVVLCATMLEGSTREMYRNKARGFLV